MKKYTITTFIALSLGQLNASTYVSGTGTSADPILLDVGVNLTANVVLGNGATLITPGGGGIFSDLDTGGYILINPGETVEITFNSAFTGEVTLFDVDSNELNGTNQDQITIRDSAGTAITVIDTVGDITANNDPGLTNDAQTASISSQSFISLEHTGNFGSTALTFEGISQIPEPSSSLLGAIGGLAFLIRRKR